MQISNLRKAQLDPMFHGSTKNLDEHQQPANAGLFVLRMVSLSG